MNNSLNPLLLFLWDYGQLCHSSEIRKNTLKQIKEVQQVLNLFHE